jgi:hypothetical protein
MNIFSDIPSLILLTSKYLKYKDFYMNFALVSKKIQFQCHSQLEMQKRKYKLQKLILLQIKTYIKKHNVNIEDIEDIINNTNKNFKTNDMYNSYCSWLFNYNLVKNYNTSLAEIKKYETRLSISNK